ncbi:MAG: MarR family transcriptional regulator [Leptospiraceae bacterium]|nr:MarR family transcriptional regulator [Leptospiraceae bacterium]MCP5494402.1 MarR family transcriptional regulator [Leptospiraceae bacterium]
MNPEDCIFFQIAKANQVASKFYKRWSQQYKLTATQSLVLSFLFVKDGVTSNELGQQAVLDSATLTGIIDRLELIGYLKREQNKNDRRAITIFLTDEGRKIAQAINTHIQEVNNDFLSDFTKEEDQTFRVLLQKIAKRL